MGVSKLIQDAIKTISEQAVSVAPYDKTRGGVVLGKGDVPNTYKVQVDGVAYSNVKAVGGIIPSVNDTVTVLFPTNNTSQMIITNINNNSWIKGASDLIYPVGAYYWTSDTDFDPNVTFAGTWEQLDEGIALVSAGETYVVNDGTSRDGGSEYIQEHIHSFTQPTVDGGGGTNNITGGSHHHATNRKKNAGSGSAIYVPDGGSTSNGISTTDTTHTHSLPNHTHRVQDGAVGAVSGLPSGQTTGDQGNMPPYKAAYCWHRIS